MSIDPFQLFGLLCLFIAMVIGIFWGSLKLFDWISNAFGAIQRRLKRGAI